MTIEEKAKAYDEALKRAKAAIDIAADKDLVGGVVRTILPELVESKDERIIRTIIDALYSHTNSINLLSSRGYQMEDIEVWFEKQKENSKLEDSWHKVADSFPDSTREVICKDAIGNFFIGRYYKGSNSWEVSMYDDINKSNEDNPPVVMWCDIPSEKQKERKPIKMEVYEVGKGTTVCGQDYKCKKDYKKGNCWYIKDVIYHCGRDGYLTDQNGVSWSCTPEWFKEYIQSNAEWAEEEKNLFVSGQFLQCKLSFDEFKEGEHYWLEYVGGDMYVGRSDNILNQKFHITPRQLYTLFSQQLEEKQKEQKPAECLKAERDGWYVCIKDFYAGGKKQCSVGDLVQAKGGMYMMGNEDISEWFRRAYYEDVRDAFGPNTDTNIPEQKPEWSEQDKENIVTISEIIEHCTTIPYSGGTLTLNKEYKKELLCFIKSLRPSWKPSEEQTNNVIVELTRVELGEIINGLYYLKEKYYEDCKEHNGTATVGLSDEFKFYFKRFNEVLDLYTRLHELEKEKYGTTTDGYYYE